MLSPPEMKGFIIIGYFVTHGYHTGYQQPHCTAILWYCHAQLSFLLEEDHNDLEKPMMESSNDEFSLDLEEERTSDEELDEHPSSNSFQSNTTSLPLNLTHPTYLPHPLANSHYPQPTLYHPHSHLHFSLLISSHFHLCGSNHCDLHMVLLGV